MASKSKNIAKLGTKMYKRGSRSVPVKKRFGRTMVRAMPLTTH